MNLKVLYTSSVFTPYMYHFQMADAILNRSQVAKNFPRYLQGLYMFIIFNGHALFLVSIRKLRA